MLTFDREGFRRSGMLALVLGLAVAVLSGCGKRAAASAGPVQMPVVAAEVLVQTTTNYVEHIGQTHGAQDVEIRARVPGFLEAVHFREGGLVSSNDLLYTIDRRPFEAAAARSESLLSQARAAWEKARRDTNRLGPLWVKNAISSQQFDDAVAVERSAAASLEAAEAAVLSARIDLSYTRILSPIEGLAGKTEVKAGNLVGQGQATLLTTISSIDPIHVRFSVSEQQYLEWARKGAGAGADSRSGQNIFELILADGSLHPHRGSVVFADRQVDAATGTLLLEAAFPNPERLVRPGQFARVRFPVQVLTNALLVPKRSIQELQATYSVFVVGAENKAQFKQVTLGSDAGDLKVVAAGLSPGDRVVIEGGQKLQNGVALKVTDTNIVAAGQRSGRVF